MLSLSSVRCARSVSSKVLRRNLTKRPLNTVTDSVIHIYVKSLILRNKYRISDPAVHLSCVKFACQLREQGFMVIYDLCGLVVRALAKMVIREVEEQATFNLPVHYLNGHRVP